MSKTPKDTEPARNTRIYFILDRSGSMSGLSDAAIKAFNDFVEEQRRAEDAGAAELSLLLFDDHYERVVDARPLTEVPALTSEVYFARGCTALLDAIGKTIKRARKSYKKLSKSERKATQVIFAIFTDGYENASQKYSNADITRMIRKREKKGNWQFLFLAAGQDAIATAAGIGIAAHNSASIAGDAKGMAAFSSSASRKLQAMRRYHAARVVDGDLNAPLSEIAEEEK